MKKLSFIAILLFIPIAFIELMAGWFSAHFSTELFSYRNEYLRTVKADQFHRFIQSPYFDARLGWNNPQQFTRVMRRNCIGQAIEYVYENGARQTPGTTPDQAKIALFGESYTQGEEVAADSTIASVLTNRHGLPAANYGVNSYDPLQATEKLREIVSRPHRLNAAVLLVMHENVWRLVNSFKPVYHPHYSEWFFGLKPYVRRGEIVELDYPRTYDDFLSRAEQLFVSDYWAKPERRFPYSLSTLQAVFSNAFTTRSRGLLQGRFRHEYESAEFRKELSAVIDRFVSTADAAAIAPYVIFIPRAGDTYRVSEGFVAAENKRLGRTLAFEFVDPGMEWSKYKLAPYPDSCHPSPYGYARIADFVAKVIGQRPAAREGPASLD